MATPPLARGSAVTPSRLDFILSSSHSSPTTPTSASLRPSAIMEPAHLPIPPAPTASDLPVDRELLQRWSSNNTPSGTPAAQRPPTHPKRTASFDSPREVPLPSPSLSLSSGSASQQPPSFPFHIPNFSSSGTTPSASAMSSSHTTRLSPRSTRMQDTSSDYFPTVPSVTTSSLSKPSNQTNHQLQSPQSSSSGSGSSSSQSRLSSPRNGYLDRKNYTGSGSDWTSQTSPSPNPEEEARSDIPASKSSVSDFSRMHARSSSSSSHLSTGPAPNKGQGTSATMTQKVSSLPPPTSSRTTTIATPIFPHPRPYSLPSSHSHSNTRSQSQPQQSQHHRQYQQQQQPPQSHQTLAQSISSAESNKPTHWPDRSSSSSLPLPTQVPFHTLPRVSPAPGIDGSENPSRRAGGGAGSSDWDNYNAYAHAAWVREEHRSEVGDKLKKHQQQQQQDNHPYGGGAHHHRHPPSGSQSSSSEGTDSARASPPANGDDDHDDDHDRAPEPMTRPPPPPQPRNVSPFRAPRPSSSPSHTSALESTLSASPFTTSAQIYRSQSQLHTPRANNINNNTTSSTSTSISSGPAVYSATSASSYPVPEPPTILPPTTAPGPFLSHGPPPADTWIEVETTQVEYRLVLRLPGFKRDGITLATKRRRILHVVADRWENGGGHFERRISFGYDADLMQVRAEFDGEMLRISIPRRAVPIELWSSPRPGPVGRMG